MHNYNVYCPSLLPHFHTDFFIIELVKNQTVNKKIIQQIVFQNLQGNSYSCLRENFLCSMLQDGEKDIRNQAFKQVLHIRHLREVDSEVKPKMKAKAIMPVNFNADTWSGLVNLSLIEVEPPTSILIS